MKNSFSMVLMVLVYFTFFRPLTVQAYEPDDYDPFLGGFVISPPAKVALQTGIANRLGVLVFSDQAAPPGQIITYRWQLDSPWATASGLNTNKITLSPKALGTYGLSVTASWSHDGQLFRVNRHFTVEAVPSFLGAGNSEMIVPESLVVWPGFPLTPKQVDTNYVNWDWSLQLNAPDYFDMFVGAQFAPGNRNHINWGDAPKTWAETYELRGGQVRLPVYFGGVVAVETDQAYVTLQPKGLPSYAPSTQLTFNWFINHKLVATTDQPQVTLPTAHLAAKNTFSVQLVFQRDQKIVTMLSSYADLIIKPPVISPAPKVSITDWDKLQLLAGMQTQIKVRPFEIANQTVSDIGLRFGPQTVMADDTWQFIDAQALKQSPSLVLPSRSLPNGNYHSEIAVTYAQVPEIGADF